MGTNANTRDQAIFVPVGELSEYCDEDLGDK